MKRKVSIFGLGYVGSVTAACLAQRGHEVIGVDLNSDKVKILESGHSPIVEASMEDLVASGYQACRLHATSDTVSAVLGSEVSLILRGHTEPTQWQVDMSHMEPVCAVKLARDCAGSRTFTWLFYEVPFSQGQLNPL